MHTIPMNSNCDAAGREVGREERCKRRLLVVRLWAGMRHAWPYQRDGERLPKCGVLVFRSLLCLLPVFFRGSSLYSQSKLSMSFVNEQVF